MEVSKSYYQSAFEEQYQQSDDSKHCLGIVFLKGCLMSFLMISRLIDFALMILQLFMLKVCAIIEVTNIDFFNYSRTERIKQNQKKKKKRKTIENILSLQDNHFLTNFNKSRTFLWFLTDNLTLSLPVTHCSNHNTSL